MRPHKLNRVMICIGLGAGLVLGTGIAKADTATDYAAEKALWICARLDQQPTVAGVQHLGDDMVAESKLSVHDAGEAISLSVVYVCPEYLPVLKRYVAAHTAPEQKQVI